MEKIYDLVPKFSNQKSFYGKARVEVSQDGETYTLISYNTAIARVYMPTNEAEIINDGNHLSSTTMKHIKEFLKQAGLKAETKQQMLNDYLAI